MRIPKSWLVAASVILIAGILYSQITPTPPIPRGIVNGVIVGDSRTPISSLPFTINRCGSYVVTRCLTSTGANGITVNASDVTIDLNGFSMTETGPASFNAVVLASGIENVRIENGTFRGWGSGIHAPNTAACQFEDLRLLSVGSSPMQLGKDSVVRNCVVYSDPRIGSGISMESGLMIGCVAAGQGGGGLRLAGGGVLKNCFADNNGLGGISASDRSVIENNASIYNDWAGFNATNSLIRGNTAFGNGTVNFAVQPSSTFLENHPPLP